MMGKHSFSLLQVIVAPKFLTISSKLFCYFLFCCFFCWSFVVFMLLCWLFVVVLLLFFVTILLLCCLLITVSNKKISLHMNQVAKLLVKILLHHDGNTQFFTVAGYCGAKVFNNKQ